MKRLFILGLIVAGLAVGCTNRVDEYKVDSKENYLKSACVYDDEVYIKRRLFEDKESVDRVNRLLFEVINSQQAIMTLMDGYSVKDVVFIKDDVKKAISGHFEVLFTALDELQHINSDRFDILEDSASKMFTRLEDLEIDYNSKDSKKRFYGVMYLQNKDLKDVVALYNE